MHRNSRPWPMETGVKVGAVALAAGEECGVGMHSEWRSCRTDAWPRPAELVCINYRVASSFNSTCPAQPSSTLSSLTVASSLAITTGHHHCCATPTPQAAFAEE